MDIAIELIKATHPLVINGIVVILGIVIVYGTYNIFKSFRINASAYENANKLVKLQQDHNELENTLIMLGNKYNQSGAVLSALRSSIVEISRLLSLVATGNQLQEEMEMTLRTLSDRIANNIKQTGGEVHRCAIWFPVDDKNLIIAEASSGFPTYYRRMRLLPIDDSIAGRCYRTRRSRLIGNVNEDPDYRFELDSNSYYNSLICVPLIFGDSCLGVLTLDGKSQNAFQREDMETVETFSKIISWVSLQYLELLTLTGEEGEPYYEEQKEA